MVVANNVHRGLHAAVLFSWFRARALGSNLERPGSRLVAASCMRDAHVRHCRSCAGSGEPQRPAAQQELQK